MEVTFSHPMLKAIWCWQSGLTTLSEFGNELLEACDTDGDRDVAKAMFADAKKGLTA